MRYLWCIIAFQYVLFVTAGVYVVQRGTIGELGKEDLLVIANENVTKVDNDTLYEGDMRMPPKEAEKIYESDKRRDATIANAVKGVGDLWPKTIPYALAPNVGGDINGRCEDRFGFCHVFVNQGGCLDANRYSQAIRSCCASCRDVWRGGRAVILAAIDEFQAKTCLRFRRHRGERDYLYFFPEDGCWSRIGRQGGKQEISLSSGCWTKRIATHEILHALGFLHEQSRPDRDSYVKVLRQNIIWDRQDQFNKYDKTIVDSLGESYDYKSIMHYWNDNFSNNGNDTIQKKDDPQYELGVRDEDGGLSVSDATQLNLLYGCTTAEKKSVNTDESSGEEEPVLI